MIGRCMRGRDGDGRSVCSVVVCVAVMATVVMSLVMVVMYCYYVLYVGYR